MSHYIDNKRFYELLKIHHENLDLARANGLPNPRPSDELGKTIIFLCRRLMTRFNFRNYTWRDEMQDAAILDCTAAINKFDPKRGENPFGYFTQVAFRAAIRVIVSEKKQCAIKESSMENQQHFFTLEGYDRDEENTFNSINANDALEFMN